MLAQEQTFPQCSGTLIYDLVIDGAGRVNSPEQAAIFCCVSGDKIRFGLKRLLADMPFFVQNANVCPFLVFFYGK
ncbi:hypothetical protein L4174_003475 [Photobacterium sp. CCB-ST2H9]|uniref:hypothetical protein n=1 Tax=Photobacterium sp. CCB-ST2H9 TaxID=2912855 RepID=UPI002005245E|nr:hypothetical protein [Photobacterium sp. CCB-ST2H9]UTM57940.1 hypothetical protein L4174_003475 [Photobacterium sp. CCB-ST2H9]